MATKIATTSKTGKDATEKTTETTPSEATTTPPSTPSPTATPTAAPESTTTASSGISTRTFGNAKANPTTTSAARGIRGLPCGGMILVIHLARMVLYEK